MIWKIKFLNKAEKQIKKLDRQIQIKILSFLYKRLLPTGNPRLFGKRLSGNLAKFWSYRVGSFRIIADIQDHHFTILAISIEHRSQVYND